MYYICFFMVLDGIDDKKGGGKILRLNCIKFKGFMSLKILDFFFVSVLWIFLLFYKYLVLVFYIYLKFSNRGEFICLSFKVVIRFFGYRMLFGNLVIYVRFDCLLVNYFLGIIF